MTSTKTKQRRRELEKELLRRMVRCEKRAKIEPDRLAAAYFDGKAEAYDDAAILAVRFEEQVT